MDYIIKHLKLVTPEPEDELVIWSASENRHRKVTVGDVQGGVGTRITATPDSAGDSEED